MPGDNMLMCRIVTKADIIAQGRYLKIADQGSVHLELLGVR